jgi:hypothetical protein
MTQEQVGFVVLGWLTFVALMMGSIKLINYKVTTRHLVVTWCGIPVRRIRLDDIKFISTRPGKWAEKWYNTARTRNRLLVMHRRSGWLKDFAISPRSPYVFKAELDRARRALFPRPPEAKPGETEEQSKNETRPQQTTSSSRGVEAAERNVSGSALSENE